MLHLYISHGPPFSHFSLAFSVLLDSNSQNSCTQTAPFPLILFFCIPACRVFIIRHYAALVLLHGPKWLLEMHTCDQSVSACWCNLFPDIVLSPQAQNTDNGSLCQTAWGRISRMVTGIFGTLIMMVPYLEIKNADKYQYSYNLVLKCLQSWSLYHLIKKCSTLGEILFTERC